MAVWNFSKNSSDLAAGPFLKQLTSILTSPTPWHIPLYLSLSGEPFLPSSSCTADHLKVETLKWLNIWRSSCNYWKTVNIYIQSNKIIRRTIVSIRVISSLPTLSWRKTSRVVNPHLHLPRSKARQDQRSSTVLFQTPSPPQDPCKPSLPQHPCTLCLPLDNYVSLPFSVTESYHGIVKSVNKTRTLETKLNIITSLITYHSVTGWNVLSSLTFHHCRQPPLHPLAPPLQPSRKPDNLHFCCNYLLSQLNKEILTNLTLWQGFNNIRDKCWSSTALYWRSVSLSAYEVAYT